MNKFLEYGWIVCYIVTYLIHVLVFVTVNNTDDFDRGRLFLEIIAWILTITGFIIFIIWLTRFKNTKVLKIMWIVSLITWIVSVGCLIFMAGNVYYKILIPIYYLLGYSFTIFIGTLITFLVKNK